eukprot:CAMPEP_0195043268 /NCGR_PEP_ID=MMETSP0347-20130606/4012_1 /TAXON_ID=2932 /ORGANISM="Alexandrium fundyense, Strain CCMP1719" /LENGTH=41 /DNA_ID= /DNA_START= /DNA_END= /DNA_ORIENTATION=
MAAAPVTTSTALPTVMPSVTYSSAPDLHGGGSGDLLESDTR